MNNMNILSSKPAMVKLSNNLVRENFYLNNKIERKKYDKFKINL